MEKLNENGDIEAYGKLSFESGYSSIHNWETGSPELIKLYEIMTKTEGIYGGWFSGTGFKGCLKAFPHLEGKNSVHICESADGVKL